MYRTIVVATLALTAACSSSSGGGESSSTSSSTTAHGSSGASTSHGGSTSGSGSTKESGSESGGSSGSGSSASMASGPTVALTGTVIDYSSSMPMAGVSVCVYSNPSMQPCVTTDASGAYSIEAPASSNVMLALTATGHLDDYSEYVTSTTAPPTHQNSLFSTGTVQLLGSLVGMTADPTKAQLGLIAFSSATENLAGATFTVTPMGGAGPYYIANGVPSTTATATDSSGTAFIINAPPGTYEVSATAPGVICKPALGDGQAWPGSDTEHGKVLGIANGATPIAFDCE